MLDQMNKFIIGFVAVLISNIAYANNSKIGRFSTVTESECNWEIILGPEGKGEFLQICRLEDGSGIDHADKQSITWSHYGDIITITFADGKENFEYRASLPCSSFGSNGATNGLVGKGRRFWKAPISCK
jgi:hypothetical protein